MGIVNGTTNFILTKMSDEGRAYNDVLKEAQQLGFAEADPTSDVEGLDAARKMTILATLGFSTNVELGDVKVKGITSITEEDIEYSKSLGYTIKLIGLAKRDGEKLRLQLNQLYFQIRILLRQYKMNITLCMCTVKQLGKRCFMDQAQEVYQQRQLLFRI